MFWRSRHPGQAPQHRQQVPSDQTVRAPHSAHQLHPAEREHPWHTKEGPVRTATVESYAGICNSQSILKTLIFFFFLYFESSVKFDCQSLPSLCSHPPDFYVLVCGHCTITYRCDFTFKLCYLLIFNNQKKKGEKSGWKQAFPFSCPLSWHLLHFTSLSLVWITVIGDLSYSTFEVFLWLTGWKQEWTALCSLTICWHSFWMHFYLYPTVKPFEETTTITWFGQQMLPRWL